MCIGLSYRIPHSASFIRDRKLSESYSGRGEVEYYGIKRGIYIYKPSSRRYYSFLKIFEGWEKFVRFNVTSNLLFATNLPNLPWNEARPFQLFVICTFYRDIWPTWNDIFNGSIDGQSRDKRGRGYQFVVGGTVNRTVFGDSSIVLRRFAWFWATL